MPEKRDPRGAQRLILDAAARAFATHGPAGARIDAIAAGAGVNKRMLYHYFGDKEALFAAVLTDRLESGSAFPPVADLMAGHSAIEALDLRLMIWAATSGVSPGAGYAQAWQRLLAELRAEQIARRLRGDVEPQVLALVLLGGTALLDLLGGYAEPLARARDASREQLKTLVSPTMTAGNAASAGHRPRVRMQPQVSASGSAPDDA